MIIKKVIVILCILCFLMHSWLNIDENIVNSKSIDYTEIKSLASEPFPVMFVLTVHPGTYENVSLTLIFGHLPTLTMIRN